MVHSRFGAAVATAFVIALCGCGGSEHAADSPAAGSMTPKEARAFIAQVTREHGIAIDQSPVTSMQQLFQALSDDQMGRFSSAAQLVAGKSGIEALALHATVELAWSDDFTTFARIFEQLGKRADFEVKRLDAKRDAESALSDADAKIVAQNQKNAAFDAHAKLALSVLADEHLRAGRAVVDQAVRQFPKEPMTYRVAAYASLLAREWPDFDAAMSWFQDTEAKDAGLVYLRGLEALNRRRVPSDATALFRAALQLNPKMVRAQAKLVLSEEGIDATYAEYEKLRAVAPQHPMVAILGPSISSDHELSSSFRQAWAAHQQPPAPAPVRPPAISEDPPEPQPERQPEPSDAQ